MNEPEVPAVPHPDPRPEPGLENLQESYRSLRNSFHVTLVLLLILTGSLFVSYLREVSIARKQINDLTQAVADYERNAVPLVEDFRTKLFNFTRTHPDFTPIYNKYFGTTNTGGVATSRTRAQHFTNTNAVPFAPPPPGNP
jgi:hypothetical protein